MFGPGRFDHCPMKFGAKADIELAGEGFPRLDAVLFAPVEVLVDGTLELTAQFPRIVRLERGYGVRAAVHDPTMQDTCGVIEPPIPG